MKKKTWDRDLVVLLVSTLITIASWVGLEVYRAYINTELPPGVEQHLKQFDPILNTSVLDKLEGRAQ
jgi:hypothetical protein